VVGGHLTVTDGPPGLSAFGLGRADYPLSAQAAEPGQSLIVGCCLDGKMRPDFPVLSARTTERGTKLGGGRPTAGRGRGGAAWVAAAKDVRHGGAWSGRWPCCSSATGFGVSLDLDALPVPAGVTLERWINCFPCLSFLLLRAGRGGEDDCLHAFRPSWSGRPRRSAPLDDTGLLRLSSAGQTQNRVSTSAGSR